ncbi:unnamed protein product [Phytophthora lilii]|uniref:Unnamed protein product n=1 Tax=Phytophthora lilii TaxID=2077276 RepID=A0A9W6XH69_9STRA|nr:unnamed protein product [Phytophthora lilii]
MQSPSELLSVTSRFDQRSDHGREIFSRTMRVRQIMFVAAATSILSTIAATNKEATVRTTASNIACKLVSFRDISLDGHESYELSKLSPPKKRES